MWRIEKEVGGEEGGGAGAAGGLGGGRANCIVCLACRHWPNAPSLMLKCLSTRQTCFHLCPALPLAFPNHLLFTSLRRLAALSERASLSPSAAFTSTMQDCGESWQGSERCSDSFRNQCVHSELANSALQFRIFWWLAHNAISVQPVSASPSRSCYLPSRLISLP